MDKDHMHQSEDNKRIPMTSFSSGKGHEVMPDIYYYTNQIVNLIMVGDKNNWVLVDSGMPKSASEILSVAEKRFGEGNKPSAIILTHGHFDHVGNVVDLIEEWNMPVYAHPLEFPYLTGEEQYPDPDPTVEGGMLAKMSSVYPHKPINIKGALKPLPQDKSIPGMPGWKWVHTPGHSQGHVSLFRELDKSLIAGDAFVTVKQDSFYKVLVQKAEVQGPPRYLTTDWPEAWDSVKQLQALNPQLVISGHGPAMGGEELTLGLRKLVDGFEEMAIPEHGRYVGNYEKRS